jgi:pyruvate/2-oxoglutarate dehydrogenase complex dihydrolipoamide acyltransferase (E2) component
MFEFKLPAYGMGMQDGTVLRWLKREGDRIEEGETLVEIEAAKSTVEVGAPCSGILVKILVAEECNVPTQTVLALIDDRPGE